MKKEKEVDPKVEQIKDQANKMLGLFGPEGEHWTQGRLRIGDSYCLFGAMEKLKIADAYTNEAPIVQESQHG